ncbi:MAG: hypothetical protein Tsb0014_26020 [Pleurocapsa sp.]
MANLATDFSFTNGNDLAVDLEDGLSLDPELQVNTLNGDDIIRGQSGSIGILIGDKSTLNTNNGNDTILGDGDYTGIFLIGNINTGNGNDTIIGKGGSFGLFIVGDINTGNGNDIVIGRSEYFGIVTGKISTGKGNDIVIGEGRDVFSGFASADSIDLGKGNDLLQGFGGANVDGGQGFDRAKFDFNSSELDGVVKLGSSDNTVELIHTYAKMTLTNFELFEFNDRTYSFDKLVTEFSDLV